MRTLSRRLSLDEELALERVLDDAYAPLRARTVALSAARARAAARWDRYPEPGPEPLLAFVPRIAQSAVTAAVLALVFVAPPLPRSHVEPPSVVREYLRSRPPFEEKDLVRWNALQQRNAAPSAWVDDMLHVDAPLPSSAR
ncbi:MAG TPA: hypothetical protein VFM93_11520 [Candidatus Limnocylindria bacterium]|nr:hypothetical protein [Candidatus Limnocylindria bacterium]